MRLRRTLPIAVLVPALLALSACSGESKESGEDGKNSKASAQGGTTAEEKAEAEAERLGAVGPGALRKAVLSGKRNGFEAKTVGTAETGAGKDVKADRAACQPLASLAGGYTHLPAVSVEHRSLDPLEAKNATVGSMWLASHSEEDARRVMNELRTAVEKCPKGFRTVGLTYTGVRPVPVSALGDEAIGYRITSVVGKENIPMTYTVVRKGGVIAAFHGVNMLTPDDSAIPEPLVKAQLDRIG
ncbi:hypothetical protein [Streptomyces filamentosus]|uniref:hypothetical protein n=1 Tax=Streptomyces filamentosus TaxID=67294 RepID=UPI0033FE1410